MNSSKNWEIENIIYIIKQTPTYNMLVISVKSLEKPEVLMFNYQLVIKKSTTCDKKKNYPCNTPNAQFKYTSAVSEKADMF